jgi:hypothetical protein
MTCCYEFTNDDSKALNDLYVKKSEYKLKNKALSKTDSNKIDKLLDKKQKSENGFLSEGAKTYIKSVWLDNEYKYRTNLVNDQILKGHYCEDKAITLVQDVLGGDFRFKNKKRFNNEYLTGEHDVGIESTKTIEDIKNCNDIDTFSKKEEPSKSDLYYGQGQGYLDLTGYDKFRLCYCLINTPDFIVRKMLDKAFYAFGAHEGFYGFTYFEQLYNQECENIHNRTNFDHIPIEKRLKYFEFERDQEYINRMHKQIELAREYYKTLEL